MNHKERLRAAMAGEAVDQAPVSVWGHDFLREWSAADLAAQTIERHREYAYDFVKINPRWTLFAEPWGNQYEPPSEQKFPRLITKIVNEASDLTAIPKVDANHAVLQEHVSAVEMTVAEIGGEVDCLATLFSPLSVLGLLCGGVGQPLLTYLENHPNECHLALEHIAETLTQHAADLLSAGASGLFFAPLQWTSLEVCDATTYATFGVPYDLKVLEANPRVARRSR